MSRTLTFENVYQKFSRVNSTQSVELTRENSTLCVDTKFILSRALRKFQQLLHSKRFQQLTKILMSQLYTLCTLCVYTKFTPFFQLSRVNSKLCVNSNLLHSVSTQSVDLTRVHTECT